MNNMNNNIPDSIINDSDVYFPLLDESQQTHSDRISINVKFTQLECKIRYYSIILTIMIFFVFVYTTALALCFLI
jgi:hypothetical protein